MTTPRSFAGGDPYLEELGAFRIGDLERRVVKPCARCVLTTTDQVTAERGPEPLRTLSTYCKRKVKVLFGQKVVCTSGAGSPALGDALQI